MSGFVVTFSGRYPKDVASYIGLGDMSDFQIIDFLRQNHNHILFYFIFCPKHYMSVIGKSATVLLIVFRSSDVHDKPNLLTNWKLTRDQSMYFKIRTYSVMPIPSQI